MLELNAEFLEEHLITRVRIFTVTSARILWMVLLLNWHLDTDRNIIVSQWICDIL